MSGGSFPVPMICFLFHFILFYFLFHFKAWRKGEDMGMLSYCSSSFYSHKMGPPQQPQFLLMDQSLLKHIIYQLCLSLIPGKHSENQKYFKERNY